MSKWTPIEKITELAILRDLDLSGDIIDIIATLNSYIFIYPEFDRIEIKRVVQPSMEYSTIIGISIETNEQIKERLKDSPDDLDKYEKWKEWQKLNKEYQRFKLQE